MTGLLMALKAFGVNVSEEHVKAVEHLIPQIPTIVSETVVSIHAAKEDFDKRLQKLELQSDSIIELFQEHNRLLREVLEAGFKTSPEVKTNGQRKRIDSN
jgi:hypothetical protein